MNGRTTEALKERFDPYWTAGALLAAALLVGAVFLPLWRMTLKAPQFPGGLTLTAYGHDMEGDFYNINSLNHYIGMKPINPDEVPELRLFRPAAAAAVLLLVVAAVFPLRLLKALAILTAWGFPLGIALDLQWYLYRYGHDLDPKAPLRIEGFTPKFIGNTEVMNFQASAMPAIGFWALVLGALLITAAPFIRKRLHSPTTPTKKAVAVGMLLLAATALTTLQAPAARAGGPGELRVGPGEAYESINQAIQAAEPGETIVVSPGVYHEQVAVTKPVVLVGKDRPVIDGGSRGHAVTIDADGVTFQGFLVRGSSLSVSDEAAGILVRSSGNLIQDNRTEQVLYGIYLRDGTDNRVIGNHITSLPERPPENRGHGVYLYNSHRNEVRGNVVDRVKDGVYVAFSNRNLIVGNRVTNSRYGIHYMYAEDNVFEDNLFDHNLAGGALMYSEGIEFRRNRFLHNSSAGSAFGLLFKDVDDVLAEYNLWAWNDTGAQFDSSPRSADHYVELRYNWFAYNRLALSLMTTADITFHHNSVVGNLVPVETLGGSIAGRNQWSVDGRGNYWSDYDGFDLDGDGVGDVPFAVDGLFENLMADDPILQAFLFTPAQQAIEMASKLVPVYRPEPMLTDEHPYMSPPTSPAGTTHAGVNLAFVAATGAMAALPLGWYLQTARRRFSGIRP